MEIIVVILVAAVLIGWLLAALSRAPMQGHRGRAQHEVEEARGLPRRGKHPPGEQTVRDRPAGPGAESQSPGSRAPHPGEDPSGGSP